MRQPPGASVKDRRLDPSGEIHVVEIMHCKDQDLVRARIDKPESGWVSLEQLSTGVQWFTHPFSVVEESSAQTSGDFGSGFIVFVTTPSGKHCVEVSPEAAVGTLCVAAATIHRGTIGRSNYNLLD